MFTSNVSFKLFQGAPARHRILKLVGSYGISSKPGIRSFKKLSPPISMPHSSLSYKSMFESAKLNSECVARFQRSSCRALSTVKIHYFSKGAVAKRAVTVALISGLVASFLLTGDVLCEAVVATPPEIEVIVPSVKVDGLSLDINISENKWKIAKQLIQEHWLLAMFTVGSAVITTLIGLQIPLAIGGLVNVISKTLTKAASGGTYDLALLQKPAFAIMRLFVAHAFAMASHIYLITLLGEGLGLHLRAKVYQQCLSLDFHRLDLSRSGELTSSLNDDISDFKHTFKQCLTQGIRCVTLLGGTAYNLYALSPILSAYVAGLVPVFYAGLYFYGQTLRECRNQARSKESFSSGIAQEVMGAVRTVRAYAAEKWELARYNSALSQSADANLMFGLHMGVFRGGMSLAVGSVILVVLYFGGQLVVQGDMQPGELMTFLVATEGAQKAMDALGGLLGQAVKASGTWSKILNFLSLPPSSTMTPLVGPGITLNSIRGELTFRNVNFSYPTASQPVIKNLNLHVPAGTTLALVGASGAGKSTVAALLERFYELPHGEILLDGIPLHMFDPIWLRGNVLGYLSQEPTLFAGTIAENICYGSNVNPKDGLEKIQAVARAANIHRFIEKLPNGYDTVVGERGATLSGGQKQRVAIARALLKDPKVLILDEATSALDGRSEAAVQEALKTLMAGRTTLVIAHRLSTIQDAHQIAVLGPANQGDSVLETGTHSQLLQQKGAYYSLFSKTKAQ
ncbi:hypothetical protein DSO57_1013182 [Entomophthora muscae]|uniref:Uncharacterized protein n=3 Tax=Entomophthora muscae TaxID=34485 RepID=A0ACC2UR76_9FUNG|nr:hypothetical protein DSO57_1013182 [Entomophthora muscae]